MRIRAIQSERFRRYTLAAFLGSAGLLNASVASAFDVVNALQSNVQKLVNLSGEIQNQTAIFTGGNQIRGNVGSLELLFVEVQISQVQGTIRRIILLTEQGVGGVDPVIGTIAPLGTNPANSVSGLGLALGSEPVVVGYSDTGNDVPAFRAIRWTPSGGTQDLGSLLGPTGNSAAFGISDDTSTIVGFSDVMNFGGISIRHGFRWTAAGGMTDLGSLAGPTGNSSAFGVNQDGSVVVGQTSMPNIGFITQADQAFRWVQTPGTNTGVMSSLGALAPGQFSAAYAVNGDGSVVVGTAGIPNANGPAQDAFIWTPADGMRSIGSLPGRPVAVATSVSADGRVVVGISDPRAVSLGIQGYGYSLSGPLPDGTTNIGPHAFRWTQPTGIQDLNTLLANAGVNMTGISLLSALAVSRNGEFISGNGIFADSAGKQVGYILRYCDATTAAACMATAAAVAAQGGTGPTIAGITSPDSVQASVDQLGDARLRLMAQQYGLAAELLGANLPIGTGTELGIYGSAGSAAGGAFGRIAFGNGFTFLAGMSSQDQQYRDIRYNGSDLGAAALRYVYSGIDWVKPFADVGGWIAIDGSMTFNRSYLNGGGTAVGKASTSGWLSYVYGRLGSAYALSPADEFAVSAEIGHEWLHTGTFAEQMSETNPFQAAGLQATDAMDVVKARAQWTHAFSSVIDATVWGAAAWSYDRSSPFQVTVPGIGTLAPSALPQATWGEYGARVGYKITASVTVDAFIDGVFGDHAIGSNAHVGGDLRYRF